MKKIYEVELSLYPQAYTVEAEDEGEAVKIAKERFSEFNDGRSVYSVESVTEVAGSQLD